MFELSLLYDVSYQNLHLDFNQSFGFYVCDYVIAFPCLLSWLLLPTNPHHLSHPHPPPDPNLTQACLATSLQVALTPLSRDPFSYLCYPFSKTSSKGSLLLSLLDDLYVLHSHLSSKVWRPCLYSQIPLTSSLREGLRLFLLYPPCIFPWTTLVTQPHNVRESSRHQVHQ